MEWIDRLNEAIDYIEAHLTEEVNYEQLGKIACCSSYHFQRMFAYMAGVPLSEYIRRRRMSLAAVDLLGGQAKVLEISQKYGYSSPTAFNRAFQAVHGVAPSLVREEGVSVKSYPPLTFRVTITGAAALDYRVETREAFRIVGLSAPLSKEIEQNFSVVPALWQKAAAGECIPKLAALMDQPPLGLLGVSTCGDAEDWRYWLAVSSTASAGGELEETTIPAFTWAIFPGEGPCPQAIQALEQRIITEWLPTSGYEYDNGPDVEVYLTPDPREAKFEVWIPVVKKQRA